MSLLCEYTFLLLRIVARWSALTDCRANPLLYGFLCFPSLCVPPFRFTQAEEAKAVIPSLREEGKIDNDVLNSLLMELTTFAK